MSYITRADAAVAPVSQAIPDERAAFIRRTYMHLAGAIAAFAALEVYLLRSPLAETMLRFISRNQYGWLMILGGFVLIGWLARGMAHRVDSQGAQYLGLALYTVAEAIIFIPILYIATKYSAPSVLNNALLLTGTMFAGLTFVAFTTRKDFSFLRGILMVGGFVAIGLIVGGTMFGFDLGLWFAVGMVVLASGAILYDTSRIIHHYRPDQHVAAALELFASVALLFWYILSIFMRRR